MILYLVFWKLKTFDAFAQSKISAEGKISLRVLIKKFNILFEK